MSRKQATSRSKKSTVKSKSSGLEPKKSFFWEKVLPPSVLAILTIIFYYPSLKYPFQFDDLASITKKFAIRFDNPLARWYNNARWMGDWLNRINYQIGQFDPFFYRAFNLIIHLLTGILLFYLILSLCNLAKNKFLANNSLLISFTTAALFLLHPVQTQTVSYVIQARLEGLSTLFIIATILIFVKALTSKNQILKFSLLGVSLLVAIIACGTKEMVIILPLLLVLVDWFFISQEKWANFKTRGLIYVIFCVLFFIVLFRYISPGFIKRALTLNMVTANNRGNILTHEAFDYITPLHFLISEFKVILHYLLMFLWPFNISVEYDWVLSESFFAADSFFPFLALVAIFSSTVYLAIKKYLSFVSFGLLWFFICVAPRTTIIPSPELICDYKTYLASIGWLFVLATALIYVVQFAIKNIQAIPQYMHNLTSQLAIISLLAIGLGLGTMNRNIVWSAPTEFWGDIVKKAPLKARGHNNYGVALSEAGRVDESIEQYKIAIKLDSHYADPLSNIAVAYSMKGETDQAIAALKGAINIFPNYAEAYNNIGTLFLKKQNYEDAEKMLKTAIEIRPYYGKAFYNLGRLYLEKNEEEKAWTYFKKATEGDLDVAEGFYTLGQMSLKLQKYEEAANAFEQVLIKGLKNPQLVNQVQFNLANCYFMLKQLDKAGNLYEYLIQKEPLNGKYIYNLAETYLARDKTNEALMLFKKVTTLPEPVSQAHIRIAACYEKLNQIDQAKSYLNELLNAQAPDQFKNFAKEELARIELAQKVKEGNGNVRMSELQNILKKALPEEKTPKTKTA